MGVNKIPIKDTALQRHQLFKRRWDRSKRNCTLKINSIGLIEGKLLQKLRMLIAYRKLELGWELTCLYMRERRSLVKKATNWLIRRSMNDTIETFFILNPEFIRDFYIILNNGVAIFIYNMEIMIFII